MKLNKDVTRKIDGKTYLLARHAETKQEAAKIAENLRNKYGDHMSFRVVKHKDQWSGGNPYYNIYGRPK